MLFSFSIIFGNLLQSWELVPTSQTGLFQAPQAKKYTSVRKNSLIYLIDFYFLKFLETLHIQGTLRILLNEGWFSWKIHIKVFLYLFFPKILIIKMLLNSEEFNSKYPVPRSSPWVKWILNISRPPKRFSSVQSHSCVRLFETPWTAARQASLSITNSWSPPKSMSMSWWCHPTISSSVVPFSSYTQYFPASGSFQMSQLFTSGGQSIGVSASTSVFPVNTQDWSPLGWTGWISFQSKGLSRVFSNITVEKHQFFGIQFSL